MDNHLDELAEQLSFMKNELAAARKSLEGQPLSIEYDNGGGQCGTRKNPAFEAYGSLMRVYLATLAEYREAAKGDASRSAKVVKFERFAKTMRKAADA